jgi:hypothetical protein
MQTGQARGKYPKFKEVVMSKLILAILGSIVLAGQLSAQTGQDSWDNLKKLVPGEEIRIVLKDAKSYQGRFELVSDEALSVRLATGNQTFARQDILRVSVKTEPHRARNAIIGAAIGFGASFGIGAAVGSSRSKEWPQNRYAEAGAIVGGVVGAPVGAALGAFVSSGGWHDVYRAGTTPVPAPRR